MPLGFVHRLLKRVEQDGLGFFARSCAESVISRSGSKQDCLCCDMCSKALPPRRKPVSSPSCLSTLTRMSPPCGTNIQARHLPSYQSMGTKTEELSFLFFLSPSYLFCKQITKQSYNLHKLSIEKIKEANSVVFLETSSQIG